MALLFVDSFDHYATADLRDKYTTSGSAGGGAAPAIASGGRRSSGSLRLAWGSGTNPTTYVSKVLPASGATCVVGVSLRMTAGWVNPSYGMQLVSVREGNEAQASLKLNSNGTISVMRSHTTNIGTTTNAITSGAHSFIEWRLVVGTGTAGSAQVRINGVLGLTLTGVNTQGSANPNWTGISLGVHDNGVAVITTINETLDLDDLYVLDGTGGAPWNDFLGDCRVDVRVPTGAGATTGWTPSAGTNWGAVDDAAPNGDTDYTSALAVLTDTFVTQDAPAAGAAILGVQHCLTAKKTDAGTVTIAPVVRHGGADFVGADLTPSTAYTVLHAIAATNPGTGAAWTEAAFNGAEFGYKRTT
jgi:hypothetical protein